MVGVGSVIERIAGAEGLTRGFTDSGDATEVPTGLGGGTDLGGAGRTYKGFFMNEDIFC